MAENEPAPEQPAEERPEDRDVERPTNRFAFAAMLLGVGGLVLALSGCFCPFTWALTPVGWAVAPVAGALAVVLGLVARGQLKYGDPSAGLRMAVSGIVTGGLTIVLSLALLLGAYLGWGLPGLQEPAGPEPAARQDAPPDEEG